MLVINCHCILQTSVLDLELHKLISHPYLYKYYIYLAIHEVSFIGKKRRENIILVIRKIQKSEVI